MKLVPAKRFLRMRQFILGVFWHVCRSIVIHYLEHTFEQDSGVGLAYIYCSYKEPNQTPTNFIASLLQQLVQADSIVSGEILDLYKSHLKKQTRPSLAEYSALLQSKALGYSRLFVVIDALDECMDNSTRESLLYEVKKLEPKLHLLVTARSHIMNLKENFPDAALLEIQATGGDIEMYVQERIKTEASLRNHVKQDQELAQTIVTTITQRVNGMSVHSYFIMDKMVDRLIGFY